MKKILIAGVIIVSMSAAILSTMKTANKSNMPHLKMSYVPESVDDLQDNSDIIIRASVQETIETIEDDNIIFYITRVKVNDCIQGELTTEYINILQTYSFEDPILQESNNDVLLFLEKYSGYLSNDDNTYVCKGLGYGQYIIENEEVRPSLDVNITMDVMSFDEQIQLNNSDELITYLKDRQDKE